MSDLAPASDQGAFTLRATIALVVGGALLFVALLWMIGAGFTGDTGNDGGGHVGGRGLNGFAGFARYLEARGIAVRRSRSRAGLTDPGLLILTPPAEADGKQLDRIVAQRRYIGPTLVVTPKWRAFPLSEDTPGAKHGWVAIQGTALPVWQGFLDNVTIGLAPLPARAKAGSPKDWPKDWEGAGLKGMLPAPRIVLGAGPANIVALVRAADGRPLAGYIPDRGRYPALAALAGASDHGMPAAIGPHTRLYPLVLVIEPDLIDNFGMRGGANALLGERLVRAAGGDGHGVVFDMTLNGFARTPNLLTLAFTPPFLAATLCLLFAAIAAGWRAFVRFGPPRRQGRSIAFGKRALVTNVAGLIGRSGRLHLLAPPYAAAARDRLSRSLGLPRTTGTGTIDVAIDRALSRQASAPPTHPFSLLVTQLIAARRRQDVLAAAAAIHTLGRTMTR